MRYGTSLRLIAVLLVLAACEIVARVGLKLIDPVIQQDWRFQVVDYEALIISKTEMIEDILSNEDAGYITLDPDLGWAINSNYTHSEIRDGTSFELYQSNGDGIRSSREYTKVPDRKIVRLAVFGDSFSHGDDVSNEFVWTNSLEQSDARLEVLNFGVPGYGTDQAYLHYRAMGEEFTPDIAVLGLMSENLNRNLNTFTPFYRHDSWPSSKPRFKLGPNGDLELIANSFRKRSDFRALIDDLPATLKIQGEHDWWYNAKYRPGILDNSALFRIFHFGYILVRYQWLLDSDGLYVRESEHYQVLLGIIQEFSETARENNSVPVVLVFPSLEVLTEHRTTGKFMYSPLLEDLDALSIRYVDLLAGFRKYGDGFPDFELIPGHFSIEGNRMAAQYVGEELADLIEETLSAKESQ
jgi:hypothetical protein